jgi:hypothetical protein
VSERAPNEKIRQKKNQPDRNQGFDPVGFLVFLHASSWLQCCPTPGDQLDNQHDSSDHKQRMDQIAANAANQTQKPQDQ